MAGLYIKLDVDFWDHPKVQAAGEPAAVLLIHMFSYVTKHRTDGFVPVTQMSRFGLRGVAKRSSKLHEVALILPSNDPEGWLIPSWLERNPSKAEIESIVEKRRSAGKSGAQARWQDAIDEPRQVAKQHAMTEKCLAVAVAVAVPVDVAPAASELTPRESPAHEAAAALLASIGLANPGPPTEGDTRITGLALDRGWTLDQLTTKAVRAVDADRPRKWLFAMVEGCANEDPPAERINGHTNGNGATPRPGADWAQQWSLMAGGRSSQANDTARKAWHDSRQTRRYETETNAKFAFRDAYLTRAAEVPV